MANTTTAVAAPYEPKPQEKRMLEAARERRRARPPSPRFKLEQTGRATALAVDHPDLSTGSLLLMEALGTASMDFVNPFVNQLAKVLRFRPLRARSWRSCGSVTSREKDPDGE